MAPPSGSTIRLKCRTTSSAPLDTPTSGLHGPSLHEGVGEADAIIRIGSRSASA